MANWNLYTEAEDQFLIENCIDGDMTYKEAAEHLGRSNAKTIEARIAKLKEIHNFKKNTVQKSPPQKAEAEPVSMTKEDADTHAELLPEDPAFINQEFDNLFQTIEKTESGTKPQLLPELDELESIPYVAVPTDSYFGEAVNIATALADIIHDDIGYFHFNKDSDTFTVEVRDKRFTVSTILDDVEV